MSWSESRDWTLKPIDALQIYALKTSPAFEAALYSGIRMAGDVKPYEEMISAFCRHIGVGFQILNDLKDWQGDSNNKLVAGQDALSFRPLFCWRLLCRKQMSRKKKQLKELFESDRRPLSD